MRVCNNGSTGFRTSSTKHETCKIKRRFFIIFPLILHQSQLFLQIFIYHKVNHSFTNSPIRGCNTFPKTSNSLKKWEKNSSKQSILNSFHNFCVTNQILVYICNTTSNAQNLLSRSSI